MAGKFTVLVIVPAPSVLEAATETAWPSGTTRTERATAGVGLQLRRVVPNANPFRLFLLPSGIKG